MFKRLYISTVVRNLIILYILLQFMNLLTAVKESGGIGLQR